MAKKIIHATGQMCNQFWIISNYLADCIENNERFSFWLPDFNLNEFNRLYSSKYVSFPLYPKFLVNLFGYENYSKTVNTIFKNKISLKIASLLLNILPGIQYIISDVACEKSKFKFKHLNTILEIISPNTSYNKEVIGQFENQIKDELLIGIHIRRGDYRTFENGKYFYSLEQYNDFMTKIRKAFSDKNVKFFIASNEKIDYRIFEKHEIVKLTNSDALRDLIGLSRCDYICGPQSTYSAWASLYYNRPLYFIKDIEKEVFEDSFIDIKTIWF